MCPCPAFCLDSNEVRSVALDEFGDLLADVFASHIVIVPDVGLQGRPLGSDNLQVLSTVLALTDYLDEGQPDAGKPWVDAKDPH